MKADRQSVILQLIEQYDIETQEELTNRLCALGFNVTQATVSRDIKALKLIKVTTGDEYNSHYKYALHKVTPADKEQASIAGKYRTLLKDLVVNVDHACNIVVLKTYAGMANAAAAAIDATHNADILGSVAGDDTIFCVLRSDKGATAFAELIRESLGK